MNRDVHGDRATAEQKPAVEVILPLGWGKRSEVSRRARRGGRAHSHRRATRALGAPAALPPHGRREIARQPPAASPGRHHHIWLSAPKRASHLKLHSAQLPGVGVGVGGRWEASCHRLHRPQMGPRLYVCFSRAGAQPSAINPFTPPSADTHGAPSAHGLAADGG